jgi:hypothetical protein
MHIKEREKGKNQINFQRFSDDKQLQLLLGWFLCGQLINSTLTKESLKKSKFCGFHKFN